MSVCPDHQQPWVWQPAGIAGPNARNPGVPYEAFQKCPVRGCKRRPPKPNGTTAPSAPQAATSAPTTTPSPSPAPVASTNILGGAEAVAYEVAQRVEQAIARADARVAQKQTTRDSQIFAQTACKVAFEFYGRDWGSAAEAAEMEAGAKNLAIELFLAFRRVEQGGLLRFAVTVNRGEAYEPPPDEPGDPGTYR